MVRDISIILTEKGGILYAICINSYARAIVEALQKIIDSRVCIMNVIYFRAIASDKQQIGDSLRWSVYSNLSKRKKEKKTKTKKWTSNSVWIFSVSRCELPTIWRNNIQVWSRSESDKD